MSLAAVLPSMILKLEVPLLELSAFAGLKRKMAEYRMRRCDSGSIPTM